MLVPLPEMDANARFMKRKVRAGALEVDREACALIVHYEIEATVLSDSGEAMLADRRQNHKKIHLKTLNERTDISRLADEILDKCELIRRSRKPQVEDLLRELQMYQQEASSVEFGGQRRVEHAAIAGDGGDGDASPASMDELPTYIERCYESVETATEATAMILELARSPENLHQLVNDDLLLGCLTRLLSDEGKKSMDLAINITSILYGISVYVDFHQALLDFKAGSLVMDVVDLEIKRHALRERERAAGRQSPGGEEQEVLVVAKQEQLLYLCFHVLLNLSDDVNTERKMSSHGIVAMLVAMLKRRNADLLTLAFAFLKKLAMFKENIAEMTKARLGEKLAAFVPNEHSDLLEQVLRLMINLAFHPKCRAHMGKAALSTKLLSLLRKGAHRHLAVRLLYLMSKSDAERGKMTQSVPMLVGTVINTQDLALVPPEVLALLINLVTHVENARACANARNAMRSLVAIGMQHHTTLVLKLLRNMTEHRDEPFCAQLAESYAPDFFHLLAEVDIPEVQVEVLGILANLPLEHVEGLRDVVVRNGTVEHVHRLLMAGFSEDDVVLEAVRLVCALGGLPECLSLIAQNARLVSALVIVMEDKQEEDEIVFATIRACHHILFTAVRLAPGG